MAFLLDRLYESAFALHAQPVKVSHIPSLKGQILWNDIDIREFNPQELRQHMATIFQDFARYDLTAQHNIGLGNVAQIENREIVQQAAIKAGIHKRITQLPQSYQSFLGRWLASEDQGVDLSSGEWQKIALLACLYVKQICLSWMNQQHLLMPRQNMIFIPISENL